ncbi:MAG: hypothetical protein ACRC9T_02045, partial [Vibrionaceae bacterium]
SGDVEIAYGYPTATSAGIGAAVIGFGTDFVPVAVEEAPIALSGGAATGAKSISYSLASLAVEPQKDDGNTFAEGDEAAPTATATCFFTYTEATSAAAASTAVTCPVDGAATSPEAPNPGESTAKANF